MTVARRATRKADRLELRLEPAQRQLLADAAAAQSTSVSSFVLTHATDAAREVLRPRGQEPSVLRTRPGRFMTNARDVDEANLALGLQASYCGAFAASAHHGVRFATGITTSSVAPSAAHASSSVHGTQSVPCPLVVA